MVGPLVQKECDSIILLASTIAKTISAAEEGRREPSTGDLLPEQKAVAADYEALEKCVAALGRLVASFTGKG